jgi:hypothetical protein
VVPTWTYDHEEVLQIYADLELIYTDLILNKSIFKKYPYLIYVYPLKNPYRSAVKDGVLR